MNCDRIAPWYRYLEYLCFGSALHRRRCHFLPQLCDASKALMLGEGDGRFLAEFVALNATAEIDYVDASAKMLRLAAAQASFGSHVRFHPNDVLSDPLPGAGYDLFVTHFFLDCFTDDEVMQMVRRVAESAAPRARWIVSEFREPEDGWRRWRAHAWVRGLYFAFRIWTGLRTQRLPDYATALTGTGFQMQSEEIASAGLLTSQMWERS